MKKTNKLLLLALSTMGALTLTSCGSEKAASLTGAYLTPAVLSYQNMRPAYNYYMTTFSFQELETYSDNTYILTVSSSMFSGLVLPDEGNDATGNERTNYVQKYFGTYTSKVNDLDSETLDITISAPSRFIYVYDSSMFYDTANWTTEMSEKGGTENEDGTITTITAEDYLKKNGYEEMTISVSTTSHSFTYTKLNDNSYM